MVNLNYSVAVSNNTASIKYLGLWVNYTLNFEIPDKSFQVGI